METPSIIKKGNKGEKDEIFYKQLIFENKSNIEFLLSIFGGTDDISLGIEIMNPNTKTFFLSKEEITKSSSKEKADIIVYFIRSQKFRYISMKSLSGAKPSILNHTPRSAKAFQTTLSDCISDIDRLANEYNLKRTNKEIGEDIPFCKLESFQDEKIKQSFIKLISYFVFTGTGSRVAENEIDSMLLINKDKTLIFIDCDTSEKKERYIGSIIDTCIISFREKGMPTIVTDTCLPWVYINDKTGKKCGSIHVRL